MRWSIRKYERGFHITYQAPDGRVVQSCPWIPKWYWKWYYPIAIWKSVRAMKEMRLAVWG